MFIDSIKSESLEKTNQGEFKISCTKNIVKE